jgi:hypothetical protein
MKSAKEAKDLRRSKPEGDDDAGYHPEFPSEASPEELSEREEVQREIDVYLARSRHLLDEILKTRKLTRRDIDRALGRVRGHTRLLLNGEIELKLHHLLAILAVARVDPMEFFDRAFEVPAYAFEGGPVYSAYRKRMARTEGFGIEPPATAAIQETPNDERRARKELRKMIRDTLLEFVDVLSEPDWEKRAQAAALPEAPGANVEETAVPPRLRGKKGA